MVDYEAEKNRLESYVPAEGGDYWSPKAGQYKVKALTEIEDTEPYPDDEEHKERAMIHIEIDGKELIWSFAKGKTMASTYGQLIHLATAKGNKLTDVEFTVVVTGEDRNRRFTVVM